MAALSFEILHRAGPGSGGRARVGRLQTPHGALETPAFFPVATYGAVRGLDSQALREAGVQGVLSNTYHLHLRPGEEIVRDLGGLHGFMDWSGPILTDSGGFQLHSLDHLARVEERGVHFRNPVDGRRHFLSPERCIEIQEALGADLIVTLDEFEPARPADRSSAARTRTVALVDRTLRWAERCGQAQRRSDQWLFGIVQGGGFAELRIESAERTRKLGFAAYAVGGLGLGENGRERAELLDASLAPLPDTVPRYLMGLGRPDDLVAAVGQGVDLFDCVVPTRNGRHGSVFTPAGRLQLKSARFRQDPRPIDPECSCPACRRYSRAYLHHLLRSGEALSRRMLALHNLTYYMRLLQALREAIRQDQLDVWTARWRSRYGSEESTETEAVVASSSASDAAQRLA